MTWTLDDTWIVIIGMLCAGSCALLGNFLVLRRMSMMGDAISHAVLPGLVAAFWFTKSRSSFTMFAGAAVVGVLTAVFTQWVQSFGKVDRGASMGVVFTTLFAIGLIMLNIAIQEHKVDLDPGCVLYGMIDLAPLDTVHLGPVEVPRAAAVLGAVLLLNLTVVGLLYKEFKLSSFDPALATTLGINATFMHYLLMSLVAITTVASFEAIGSILVIAMLIVPAAAAFLMTERLGGMILVSIVIGSLSAALGHVAAIVVPPVFGFQDTTTAGMMATVAGLIFTGIMLLAPKQGIVMRVLDQRRLSRRIVREDILGLLYRVEEQAMPGSVARPDATGSPLPVLSTQGESVDRGTGSGLPVASSTPASALSALTLTQFNGALTHQQGAIRGGVHQLLRQGKLDQQRGAYALTGPGRDEARAMIRGHRLWESYLEQNLPLPVDHLHAPAEKLEHITDSAMRAKLAEATNDPAIDPQGRQVPR